MTTAAIIVFALTQLADVLTTERFLRHGYEEQNPLIKAAMDKFGMGWILVKGAMAVAVVLLALHFDMPSLIWVVSVITGAVAVHNWRLVK